MGNQAPWLRLRQREVFGGEGSLPASSRPLQAGGCPQRDLLTYGDGGLLACGEQEVVSCLQVWGSAGQVSGWPSDAAQSQASPAGLPSHAGGSPMGKGQLPLLSEHSVTSARRFSLVSCAPEAACFCSRCHLPILPVLGSQVS